MKGLELAEEYYETRSRPMLEAQFPHIMDQIEVGLVGLGSECCGFDNGISMDHDYDPISLLL